MYLESSVLEALPTNKMLAPLDLVVNEDYKRMFYD